MAAYDLIVRGGHLGDCVSTDVAILDGHIVELAPQVSGHANEVLDARGLLVLPGAVDPHVHFNQPGRTRWEGLRTGTRALAAGGTTTACDMPLNSKPPTVDADGFERKARAVRRAAHIDVALWGGIVPGSLAQMPELAARGVVGFKAFMCDSGVPEFPRADDEVLAEGMRVAATLGLPVAVHAEDQALVQRLTRTARAAGRRAMADFASSRPALAELRAVERAVELAAQSRCSLHVVHVSTAQAARHIAEARAAGVNVTCEATAHHLTLDARAAERLGAIAKCAPPLRPEADVEALCSALERGDVDFVASDHSPAPASLREARDAFRSWGGIGAGQLLSTLIVDLGRRRGISLARLGEWLAHRAARRTGLSHKGAIRVGGHADLVLFDLAQPWLISDALVLHRHPRTPFNGRIVCSSAVRTLLRGHTVAMRGQAVGPPRGKLLRRGREPRP